MSRFTFTLALAMVAVFAFGQRVTTQKTFNKNDLTGEREYKKVSPNNEKNVNLNTLFDEDFDTYNNNNTNGAPDGWVVTSNIANQDSLNMFRNLAATHPSEIGTPWAGQATVRDEFLISPEFDVNPTNPQLWIDQRISHYWYVDQNSDDLIISVSDDDFATETVVFKEDDQALVEAAGLPWDYVSFDPYTAKIDLTPWAGSTIKVKFNTKSIGSADGTQGVSYYLDRVRSVENPQYDVATSGNYIGSWYEFGKYSIMPWDEVRGFNKMEAWATNQGYDDVTNVMLTATVNNGSTPILSIDTNFFLSGEQNLLTGTLDTFRMVDANAWMTSFDLFSLQPGDYIYKQTISMDETDANPSDNSWSYNFSITNSTSSKVLSRETDDDGYIGMDLYTDGAAGDKIGVKFICMQGEEINGISVWVDNSSSVGTVLKAFLYDANDAELASSGERDIDTPDLGNQVYIPFTSAIALDSLTQYSVAVSFGYDDASGEKLRIRSFGGYKNDDMYQMGALNLGGTWYAPLGATPKVLIHLTPNPVLNSNEVVNNNVSVYPNPTTGLLNVNNLVENSTIKVYNMIGAEVAVVENANQFNTIDLSSYNEGTYLVKIFSNNNIIVKKVNLVK